MTKIAESYVGIDISKARLDIHLLPQGRAWSLARDQAGLAELVRRLSGLEVGLVVLEATGGYERAVMAALQAAGLPLARVNPRQVRDFARATGQLAKTDKLDAQTLARYAQCLRPRTTPPPGPQHARLQALVTRRQQLVQMRTAEKTRLAQADLPDLRDTILALVSVLSKQILAIETQIQQNIQNNNAWRQKDRLITSLPGLGPLTAATLIALMPELGNISRHQAAALAGLAPLNRDSGTFRGTRAIWGGRANLRKALYMPALTATRCNPTLKAFYKRLIEKGKKPKVALTAVMRKLIIIINAIIRDQKSWQQT